MELPKRKKGSKRLPPKGPGGGAAARQRQFDLERGLDVEGRRVTPEDLSERKNAGEPKTKEK